MKKQEGKNKDVKKCGTSCLECAFCKAVHFKEARKFLAESKSETMQLYGAEASSYYFYFSQMVRAVK